MSDFTARITNLSNPMPEDDSAMMNDVEQLPPHLQGTTATTTMTDGLVTPSADALQENQGPEFRDDALYLEGVDNLSTREIKLYLDSKLRSSDISLENLDKNRFKYTLQWINDTSINIVFDYLRHKNDDVADDLLVDTSNLLNEALQLLTLNPEDCANLTNDILRPAFPYSKEILESTKAPKTEIETSMETENQEAGDALPLQIRQSFKSDVKVKEARNYSRYYLIHGEPTKQERLPNRARRGGDRYRERDTSNPSSRSYYEDYLNGNDTRSSNPSYHPDEEEGLLNYDNTNLDEDSRYKQYRNREQQNYESSRRSQRWGNDRYDQNNSYDYDYDQPSRDTRGPRGPRGPRNRDYGRRGGAGVAHFRRERNYNHSNRSRNLRDDGDEEDLMPNFGNRNRGREDAGMESMDTDRDAEMQRQRDRSPDRM